MAIIYSYPVVSSLNSDDQIILSRMSDSGNPTKSVTLSTLKDFVTGASGGGSVTGTGTTHKLPVWTNGGGGVIGDSIFTQDAGATNVTIGGDVKLADNKKILLGTGDDFELYFDATDGIIKSVSKIELRGDTVTLFNSAKSETLLAATNGGSVDLYYNNTKQFETTSTGVKSNNNLELDGDLIDINGNTGTAGQILSSLGTGNGVDWIDTTNDVPYVDASSNRIARTEDVTNGNTSLGHNALQDIDAAGALYNTALGTEAGTDLTTGDNNTAIGYRTLYTATTQNDNTAVGYLALTLCTGEDNVAVGSGAGQSMTTGQKNVLVGYNAGDAINSGQNNIAIGWGALGAQTTDNDNIAVGYNALQNLNGSGKINIAIGKSAGAALTTGDKNTIVGHQAGTSLTGSNSALIGYFAGNAVTSGNNNTALGKIALQLETTGGSNTALGENSLATQNGASSNTAVGKSAGADITTGGYNTLVGSYAGQKLTVGESNVAIGGAALNDETGADDSVAIGRYALLNQAVTTGDADNVGVGISAGQGITTGTKNTVLGANAGTTASMTGDNNTIIGDTAQASANTISNEFTLGNSSIATLRCQQTSITSLSDQRDKTSIEDLPYGLDFVDSLQPKKFVWDNRAETRTEEDENGNQVEVEYFSANKGKKDVGFIAQDLQTVDDDWLNLVYDANPEKLEATYGKLIPVLVKAIKELKARVEALES